VEFVREGLETGDIAQAGNPMVALERKTVSDFLGSITAGRERFENELRRARHLDFFAIIVEGSVPDCMSGGMSIDSLMGTIAAFYRRRVPIIFAGTESFAARIAFRIFSQPLNEANKLVGAVKRAEKKPVPANTPQSTDGKPLY
jgi:ERCC4-type nuclease